MKNTPMFKLIKEIDSIPFNAPECADYYNEISKLFKRALEREAYEFSQAYSHGWHDGQDVIINQVQHVNLGGDAAGMDFYKNEYNNPR